MIKTAIVCFILITPLAFAEARAENLPEITIDGRNWQIGEIVEGKKKKKTFQIENTGSGELVIEKIRTSCACLSAAPSKTAIPPKGTADVEVKFDSRGKAHGLHTHLVKIFYNDPDLSPFIISVNTIILAPYPSITSKELRERMEEREDTVILDVREENEYLGRHIKGAIWIPKSKFDKGEKEVEDKIKKIDKGAFIVVHCGSGQRSLYVVRKLRERGYNAVNLDGISVWDKKGYPLERGPKIPQSLVPAVISLEEAYEHYFLLFGEKIVWIDVREEEEYKEGHIKGAINIPVSKLEDRLASVPREKGIVFYCQGYHGDSKCEASMSAGKILLEHGYKHGKIKVFEDGYYAWKERGRPIEISRN